MLQWTNTKDTDGFMSGFLHLTLRSDYRHNRKGSSFDALENNLRISNNKNSEIRKFDLSVDNNFLDLMSITTIKTAESWVKSHQRLIAGQIEPFCLWMKYLRLKTM